MSCGIEQELTAYIDGELSTGQRQQLESHLAGCVGCRATLTLLRHAVARLSILPAFEPSPRLRREVLRRLDAEPGGLLQRLRQLFRPVVLVPSLGLVTAALVAVLLARVPGKELMTDPAQLELGENLELVSDLEVIGLNSLEDLEVVKHLHELESQP